MDVVKEDIGSFSVEDDAEKRVRWRQMIGIGHP